MKTENVKNVMLQKLLGHPVPSLLLLVHIRPRLICYRFYLFKSLLARFGFAAVISPVFVADKAKSVDFKFRAILDLTCDIFSKIS